MVYLAKKPDRYTKVLLKVRELNNKDVPATFIKLCEELPHLEKSKVLLVLNVLGDCDLVRGSYGDVGNNRACYIYHATQAAIFWLDN